MLTLLSNTTYNVVLFYTLEVYSTRIRGAASSLSFISGRVFSAFVPYLLIISGRYMASGPFILFGVFCSIGFITGAVLQFETNQKELDTLLS